MLRQAAAILVLITCTSARSSEDVSLPPRSVTALAGSVFARKVNNLDLASREREVVAEVTAGNVPEFWKRFVEVKVERSIDGRIHRVSYRVGPDYLAIGSDEDYLLMPVTPATAQTIADALGCTLPTSTMVEDIYAAADVKLAPATMAPNAQMKSVGAFVQHNTAVSAQRASFLSRNPLGALVAGHKKDVVITRLLESGSSRVAIFGWQRPGGAAIQPLYTGHTADWVDYSHGIRLVRRKFMVNGESNTIDGVLADPSLAPLLSDEGVVKTARYDTEVSETVHFEPGVRVVINSPVKSLRPTSKPTRLILYALPNGSSVEQTAGRRTQTAADWRFEIQHIAAQMCWLRAHVHDANIVIAYLECAEKAWPAWRRKNDTANQRIPAMVAELAQRFSPAEVKLVLTGHSGGGSLTFGLLNGVEEIPASVERIAFLDSNYAYDHAQNHDAKLARWLTKGAKRYLTVLAYNDGIALLEGKSFVSASGGTWGRSAAMLRDLGERFSFASVDDPDLQRRSALDGRVKFFLRENPTRAIFHTRMVELNGFIHAMLSGTEAEEQGYDYLGPRVYSDFIAPE